MDEAEKPRNNQRKKKIALTVFGVLVVIGLLSGLLYIRYTKTHISTDDAFVEGAIHTIAPKVSGSVLRVHVDHNEKVKEGQLLAEIEPDVFQQKVNEAAALQKSESSRATEVAAMIEAQKKRIAAAEAALEKAATTRDELAAALEARRADTEAKKAILRQAAIDLRRAENLISKEVIPLNRYDNAKTAYDTALAESIAAEERQKQAEVAVRAQESSIRQAEASLKVEKAVLEQLNASLNAQRDQIARRKAQHELEKINLSYTKIYSPADGYVTRKSVEVGNRVQVGQPLMAIVPLSDVYIIANYKETQLQNIRPGQRVKIKVDAYPGKVFWGRVDSIMAGTGAVFSLFPPENATGNYVKVVQRIPVKIVLEEATDREHLLRVGMSITPTVLVQ